MWGVKILKLCRQFIFGVIWQKNPIINFQHIVIQVVWKNTRLLHLSLALSSGCDGSFAQSGIISESAWSYRLLHPGFLVTGDVATSWLTVKKSDVSWVAGNTGSQLESVHHCNHRVLLLIFGVNYLKVSFFSGLNGNEWSWSDWPCGSALTQLLIVSSSHRSSS